MSTRLVILVCAAALSLCAVAQPAPPASPVPPPAPGLPAAPAPPVPPAPPGVPGEGRQYAPGAFDGIEISGAASVRFMQGDSDQVFVEGDADAQKAVTLEVRDGLLIVRPGGAWKFWSARRSQLTITARDLKRVVISGAADLLASAPVQLKQLSISISGSGQARFDQIKADTLSFQVSGAGDGQLAGSVNQLSVSVSGRGDFRGEHLMSQRAGVKVSGIADVKVWAVQTLDVDVSGVGTVDHWGSATVHRRSSGIAKINDHGPKR